MTQYFYIRPDGSYAGSYDPGTYTDEEGEIVEVNEFEPPQYLAGLPHTLVAPGSGSDIWDEATNAWLPAPPMPPTSFDVDAERDRRIISGFTFNGVFFQSRPEDRENIAGASTAALAAMMGGAQEGDFRWTGGDVDFTWIAADNSEMPLDAQGMFALGTAAMAHKESHIRAARALKNMDPIPADFATNPAYWP